MKQLKCLRCNGDMNCLGREKVQLGEAGLLFRDLPHLLAGALELEIYTCADCGNVEFFRPKLTKGELSGYSHKDIPQKQCPNCGETHDFDYPKCPYCDFNYYE